MVPLGTGYRKNFRNWVSLGTGYRENFKKLVPLSTGYRENFRSWVPMGTVYRGNFKRWVPMGTVYRPDKNFWLPMSTRYRPDKFFWVLGTGQIFNDADPWLNFESIKNFFNRNSTKLFMFYRNGNRMYTLEESIHNLQSSHESWTDAQSLLVQSLKLRKNIWSLWLFFYFSRRLLDSYDFSMNPVPQIVWSKKRFVSRTVTITLQLVS